MRGLVAFLAFVAACGSAFQSTSSQESERAAQSANLVDSPASTMTRDEARLFIAEGRAHYETLGYVATHEATSTRHLVSQGHCYAVFSPEPRYFDYAYRDESWNAFSRELRFCPPVGATLRIRPDGAFLFEYERSENAPVENIALDASDFIDAEARYGRLSRLFSSLFRDGEVIERTIEFDSCATLVAFLPPVAKELEPMGHARITFRNQAEGSVVFSEARSRKFTDALPHYGAITACGRGELTVRGVGFVEVFQAEVSR